MNPDPQMRAVLLEAHLYETAAKSLENLHRQEHRLRRQYVQEIKELERLRAEREKARSRAVFQEWWEEQKAARAAEEAGEYEQQQVQYQQSPALPHGFELSN